MSSTRNPQQNESSTPITELEEIIADAQEDLEEILENLSEEESEQKSIEHLNGCSQQSVPS